MLKKSIPHSILLKWKKIMPTNFALKKVLHQKYSDSILMPELIQLDSNLIMASFHLMKLMPAKYVIEKALKEKRLDPAYPIVETSSGTYALGIGIICAELGIPFHIVSDPAIDDDLQRRLNDLGGEVQILTQALTADNPQIFRLNTLKDYLHNHPGSFWPSQYNNPDNQLAYSLLADYFLENIGDQFTLVGTVGSGGSTSGTIQSLRKTNSKINLVGVDTFGSVLFGLENGKRMLRGLGNSILPGNLQHDLFDEIHWVSAQDAFTHTRQLHAKKSCFHGPTTGAAYQVAKWKAEQNKDEIVVFIAPDTGHRYHANVYNDIWLKEVGLYGTTTTLSPHEVSKPIDAKDPWAYFKWNRKPYHEVIK
jgi:cysteine synthase